MHISVVIINFNGIQTLRNTIQSIKNGKAKIKEIIVVDNGSNDESVNYLKSDFPDVKVLELSKGTNNESKYSANYARNLGIKLASQPIILVSDNDIIYKEDCIVKLQEFIMKSKNIASCSPRLLYLSNPNFINMDGGSLHYLGAMIARNRDLEINNVKDNSAMRTIGCGINLFRKPFVEHVGLYDDQYRIGWGDDASLQAKLELAGYECWHVPEAVALHAALRLNRKNPYRVSAQISNRWRFFLTIYSLKTLILCLPMLIAYEFLLIIFSFLNKSFNQYIYGLIMFFSTITDIYRKRIAIQNLRRVSDRFILHSGCIYIPTQFQLNIFVKYAFKIIFGIFNLYWKIIRILI